MKHNSIILLYTLISLTLEVSVDFHQNTSCLHQIGCLQPYCMAVSKIVQKKLTRLTQQTIPYLGMNSWTPGLLTTGLSQNTPNQAKFLLFHQLLNLFLQLGRLYLILYCCFRSRQSLRGVDMACCFQVFFLLFLVLFFAVHELEYTDLQ